MVLFNLHWYDNNVKLSDQQMLISVNIKWNCLVSSLCKCLVWYLIFIPGIAYKIVYWLFGSLNSRKIIFNSPYRSFSLILLQLDIFSLKCVSRSAIAIVWTLTRIIICIR